MSPDEVAQLWLEAMSMDAGWDSEDAPSRMYTLPGCDSPAHERWIHAQFMAVIGGHPSAVHESIHRMPCGCAVLVLGTMRIEW